MMRRTIDRRAISSLPRPPLQCFVACGSAAPVARRVARSCHHCQKEILKSVPCMECSGLFGSTPPTKNTCALFAALMIAAVFAAAFTAADACAADAAAAEGPEDDDAAASAASSSN